MPSNKIFDIKILLRKTLPINAKTPEKNKKEGYFNNFSIINFLKI